MCVCGWVGGGGGSGPIDRKKFWHFFILFFTDGVKDGSIGQVGQSTCKDSSF